MKNFDARWKDISDRARGAALREEQAPFGFAVRVVSRALLEKTPSPDITRDRLVARFLIGATAVLLFCAAMEWPHLRDARPLDPGIENSVAQLVWKL